MTHITFTDPNIRSTGTFDVGEHMITAPIIQASEAADIVRSTGRSADAYFSAGKRPLSALQRSFALWSDPGYPLRREALPTLAALTHFSEANIACYGLAPLGEIRLDPERLINLPGELAQLIS